MTAQEPHEVPDDPGALLRSFLEFMLSPDEVQEILRLVEKDASGFLSAPRTMMIRIQDELQKRLAGTSPGQIQDRVMRDLPALVEFSCGLALKSFKENLDRVSGDPLARDLLGFLLAAAESIGHRELLEMLLQKRDPFDFVCQLSSNPLAHGPASANSEAMPFEARAQGLSGLLASYAESWYKPFLQKLLRISYRVQGKASVVPNELGPVIGQCRDTWTTANAELLSLLDARLCLIRNARAHNGDSIDPRVETITWINKKPNGTEETLGPWNMSQVDAFVQRTHTFLINLDAALAVAEERLKMILGIRDWGLPGSPKP